MDVPTIFLRFPEGDDTAADDGAVTYSVDTGHTGEGIVGDGVDG
jgi:hypothetical protein